MKIRRFAAQFQPIRRKEAGEAPPTFTVEKQPENGTVQLAEDGNWVYTPNEGFTGDDSFIVAIGKADGNKNYQGVAVSVNPKNGQAAAAKPVASLVPKTGQAPYSKAYLAGLAMIFASLAVIGTTYWRSRREK